MKKALTSFVLAALVGVSSAFAADVYSASEPSAVAAGNAPAPAATVQKFKKKKKKKAKKGKKSKKSSHKKTKKHRKAAAPAAEAPSP